VIRCYSTGVHFKPFPLNDLNIFKCPRKRGERWPPPQGAAPPLCLSNLRFGARTRTPGGWALPTSHAFGAAPSNPNPCFPAKKWFRFWFPLGFDKQSGSVRGWETDEPHSGCAQAPSLCAGLFYTPASVGDPSPDDRSRSWLFYCEAANQFA